ncbi:MAG: DUF2079 domain-containing protein [Cyanobacteria bacterium SBLK]|nr:DUF2079 domain-containing protein [Cyanobacteria bacterium SBLK]
MEDSESKKDERNEKERSLLSRVFTHPLIVPIALASSILFACSSVRHALFHSTAYDLSHFDQAIYLIGQGKPAIVSLIDYHFLGSHADWILYLLALPYKLYPDVHWLFAIQAIALSFATLPLWYLAKDAGLSEKQSRAISWVYLLYPLIFNVNLFDFHPSVLAIPLILGAVLAARRSKIGWFAIAILLILGCRAALSLTAIGLGVWLLFWEKRRWCGAIALCLGLFWLIISTQVIIPHFRPEGVEALGRYAAFGNSIPEIILNLFLKPHLVLKHLFTLANLEYLLLLFSPLIFSLSWLHLQPLIATIPDFALNLLADYPPHKDLLHQYSLPIVPFLMLCLIASLSAQKGGLKQPKVMVVWSAIAFIFLAKFGYFGTRYLQTLGTWQATREAVSLVRDEKSLLTSAQIAPHLSHRPLLKLIVENEERDPTQFDTVLVNVTHPGWNSNSGLAASIVEQLKVSPEFTLNYERDRVYLFEKKQDEE